MHTKLVLSGITLRCDQHIDQTINDFDLASPSNFTIKPHQTFPFYFFNMTLFTTTFFFFFANLAWWPQQSSSFFSRYTDSMDSFDTHCLHRADECKFFAGWITLVCPCEGVHWRKSLMSLFLLLWQWPECLTHLTGMVFKMGGKWPYSCCFVCRGVLPGFV